MTDEAPLVALRPFEGVTAPLLFGVEHEYNLRRDGACDSDCHCEDCWDNGDCMCDVMSSFSGFDLPDEWDQHDEHCGWEVKTPPTRDIAGVLETFSSIANNDAVAGYADCGFHVHVNADPTKGPAVNPAVFHQVWTAHREEIYRVCPAPHNGGVGVQGGREYAYEMTTDTERWLADVTDRYREVNVSAINSHTTIEVRLAAATGDMEVMERWLRTVLAVAEQSLLGDEWLDELSPWVAHARSHYNDYNAIGYQLVRSGIEHSVVRALCVATREV